jgi:hypothetical protein
VLPSNGHDYKVQNLGFQTMLHARESIKNWRRFSILKLFFHKTCDNGDVSKNGVLLQLLKMKKKRFLKSFPS